MDSIVTDRVYTLGMMIQDVDHRAKMERRRRRRKTSEKVLFMSENPLAVSLVATLI